LYDRRITDNDVKVIRRYIEEDGKLDMDDLRFLVGLLSEADEVCPAFDELFFPALKEVILADGRIAPDEIFYLMKMLYSDGQIRESEKQFLLELSRETDEFPPEFQELCDEAMSAHPRNWSVGGR
jgi:hypothetical protein